MNRYRILIVAGAMAAAASAAHAQAGVTQLGSPPPAVPKLPAYRNRLLGVFSLESGEAIEGAEVVDVMSRTTAKTTKTGTVSLIFLPDGGSLVKVQKIGYEPTTIMVAISPADTVPFTVLLKPAGLMLPTVTTTDSMPKYISAGLRAFEERRRAGIGKFVTEAELRKEDNRNLTNVIRQMGVKVECSSIFPYPCYASAGRVAKANATGGSCPYDIYQDGILINRDDRNLDKMRTEQYAAIEAYNGMSEVPAQYNKTGNTCGVLLLWTRRR